MVYLLEEIDLKAETIIGGNVDIDKLRVCMQDAQLLDLEPLIGHSLYRKIENEYEAGLNGDYKTLYDDYLKPYLIHSTVKNYLAIGAYMIDNAGIYKHSAENTESVTRNELDYIYKSEKSKCDVYAQRMERWLCKNRLPEWLKDRCNTVKVNNGSWYF
ncbi:hypothetical protein [Flavobacterium kingsejongi]|uniref:Uncharacterized protein n=1 Tax=Flavobacterium kingsejongi TaxID=1678728 RepID=A0A2S1LU36_9FLAO|nr:hypothetical protein [Flavobacterium kingsejongi]AWG27192.1 hypothetical protein FK004_19205 [Flavobacterium kingsejongi]